MVTYADMITLLLVFFIILYSMSSLQLDRFNALVQSLKTAFSGNAIVDQSYNPPTTNYTIPIDAQSQKKSSTESDKDKKKLDKLYTQLDAYIKKNHLEGDVELENMTIGVQVTVKDHILFDLGKATIKPEAKPLLKKLGGILTVVDNHIHVEGYTDNHPIGPGSPFASNWDLSGARAENVMLYLINEDKIKPERMSFVGFGEYAPRVPNDTEAHKSMNRRVNIVIERNAAPAN